MRLENSIKNAYFAFLGQFISSFLAFLTRTVFINVLGSEYLGIEGLFTNILSILSLASLGFDSAISFSLYKPIKNNDIDEISAYMNLYKKIYKIVAGLVFTLGIMVIPFIPMIVGKGVTINENINFIYFLFLVNSSVSYLYSYKQSLLFASQKNYIISKVHLKFVILTNIIQILVLILFKNYIITLIFQLALRIIENITIAKYSDKEFPFLNDRKQKFVLSNDKKGKLYHNVYSMLLYKISGTVINSTDNIVISSFLGISFVGIYSNYLLIVSTIKTFTSYIFYSVTASVGNLLCTDDVEKKKSIFDNIQFLSFWIYGFCSISLWILINDFIGLWIGKQYSLSATVVFVIVLNFYTEGMQSVVTIYRDTSGLFNIGKYKPIIAAIINILISVILVNNYGIVGVLLGTIISRLCVYFWFDPYVISKHIFNCSSKFYFIQYIKYVFVVSVAGFITYSICSINITNNLYVSFIIHILFSLTIPNLIFYIIYRKNNKFKYFMNIINSVLYSKKIRK